MNACKIAAATWLLFSPVAFSDLIINPGFESGDFSDWGTFGQNWRIGSGGDANSGTFGAVNDVTPADGDEWRGIFQNVAVVEGQTYTAGVFIRAVNVESSSSWFELQWLDTESAVISQLQSSHVTSDQAFTFMSVNDVVAPIGAVTASLRAIVHMSSAPAEGTDFHIFDDFSIVPEPGSLALIALGFMGILINRRRLPRI